LAVTACAAAALLVVALMPVLLLLVAVLVGSVRWPRRSQEATTECSNLCPPVAAMRAQMVHGSRNAPHVASSEDEVEAAAGVAVVLAHRRAPATMTSAAQAASFACTVAGRKGAREVAHRDG